MVKVKEDDYDKSMVQIYSIIIKDFSRGVVFFSNVINLVIRKVGDGAIRVEKEQGLLVLQISIIDWVVRESSFIPCSVDFVRCQIL